MRNPIRLCSGVLLAFVAGYIDTATFLRVSELFSAHITGNFVVFAIALVHGVREVDWLKLIALPVFFLGVPLATFLYDRTAARIRTVLICELALLGGVGLLALVPQMQAHVAWLAMALVLAMAFQNAAHQLDVTLGPTSAVMTTNAAKLFVALSAQGDVAARRYAAGQGRGHRRARALFRGRLCGFGFRHASLRPGRGAAACGIGGAGRGGA